MSKKKEEFRFSEDKLRYDKLRLEKPDVGALCAKIRAEFTMHNSLTVIFVIDAICYRWSALPFHWYAYLIFIALILTTAYRGRTTNDTFNETITKFVQLLNDKNINRNEAASISQNLE